jgi:hypothetical protein
MVTKFRGKFVVDDKGKPVNVLLDIKTYRKLIAEIEELESIRAFNMAKASGDKAIPFKQAVLTIVSVILETFRSHLNTCRKDEGSQGGGGLHTWRIILPRSDHTRLYILNSRVILPPNLQILQPDEVHRSVGLPG